MANEQDALFVNQVVRSNVAEITEGNLAVQHSPELAVNEFGRWMVTDHTAMNAMLTTEASEACLPVPTDLSPEQQAEVNTLSQLSGTDFDRTYVSAQVSDHEATLALLRQEVSGGEDPNLISLAQSSIPIVQAHLDEAQILTTASNPPTTNPPTTPPTAANPPPAPTPAPAPIPPVTFAGQQLPPGNTFAITDTSTGQSVSTGENPYTGPVAGLQSEIILITPDNLNIAATTPNTFIHTGSGVDALRALSGTNVLDGGTNSNFLTGGSGTDTFFVDERGATSDIWSTVDNFHAGDAATIWGVTPQDSQDFSLSWQDGQGAPGHTGLTLHATAPGKPIASLTLAGYSTADINNGRLSVSFGSVDGNSYMYVHANS